MSNKAGTDVTLKLDNGSSITIKAGDTVGTVTVPAPSDDVFIDKSTQTSRSPTPLAATSRSWKLRAMVRPRRLTTPSTKLMWF
ncbi:immunoglobulin-like domain-containing protein [Pseudomonas gelidaquae]